MNDDHPVVAPTDADALVQALANIDWGQVAMNNIRGDNAGACFRIEGARICGRSAAWAGHDSAHLYVPLHVAVSQAMRRDAAPADDELALAAKACVFEGLTANHEPPYLIPSDLLLAELQRLRAALAKRKGGAK